MWIKKFGLFEDVANEVDFTLGDKPIKYFNEGKTVTALKYYMPEGYKVEDHFHDWIEFTLVIKGEQKITVCGKEYILHDGDFLMVNYNDIHSSYTLEGTDKVTMQFKMGFIEKLIPEFDSNQIICSTFLIKNSYDHYTYDSSIELFIYMFNSFINNASKPKADFYGFFYLFFYRLMKECKQNEEQKRMNIENNTYIDQIISYINRHYNEHLTLNLLSQVLHISPQYISKIIKEETGIGFKEYLVKLRLEYATNLIKNSDKNLLNICQECGFSNNKSFIYYFKEHYGISPSQYRKEHK